VLGFSAAAATTSVVLAETGAAVRVPADQLPAPVRKAAEAGRQHLCPTSKAPLPVRRADLDGDRVQEYFLEFYEVGDCKMLYPAVAVWWNKSGRFVEDFHSDAVLHHNRSGHAFFQFHCNPQARYGFRIEYFDGRGQWRRSACIPWARHDAVRKKYGFN
jgi:hypothetical protein